MGAKLLPNRVIIAYEVSKNMSWGASPLDGVALSIAPEPRLVGSKWRFYVGCSCAVARIKRGIQRLAWRLVAYVRLGGDDVSFVELRYDMVGMECRTDRCHCCEHCWLVLQPLWHDGISLHLETRATCLGIYASCVCVVGYGVGLQLGRSDDLPLVAPWSWILERCDGGAVV